MAYKRITIAALVALILTAAAFADGSEQATGDAALTANISRYVQLDLMAAAGMMAADEGVAAMREYSAGLDPFYREILYERYKKDATGAALLNFFTGGLGSWTMGDRLAGGVLTAGGVTVMAMSVLMMPMGLGLDIDVRAMSKAAMISGTVVGVAGIAYPYISAHRRNARLREALSY
ncbi:MAG TPA: hypothetical protein P5298_14920 [Spirochaetia bacterium]|nr:hypothetical protein [Spirochaetia bacterium]